MTRPAKPSAGAGRTRAAWFAVLAACCGIVHAQQDLETSVPANWTASTGTLAISDHHYKLGSQSLRWDWSGGGVITVSSPGIPSADVKDFYKNTCDLWVWNGTAIPGGKLRVEFRNGSTAQYWFDFQLDYTGWRHAVRSYAYDMSKKTNPSSTFTSVRIYAPASGNGSFFFDAVNWVGDRFTRIRDAQNPDITGSYSSTAASDHFANVPDIDAVAPTAAELTELSTLRTRWLATVKGTSAPSGASVTSANASFAAMDIVEDANGIRGQAVGTDTTALESWPLTLARDYAFGTATATASRDKMLQLLRHLTDQGFAANSNEIPWGGSGGYDFRNLPNALILMTPACDATTKAALWDFLRWNYVLGKFWSTNWERDTDDMYTGSLQMLGAILFLTPDDTEAVRMLKGFQRHVQRFLVISQGSEDGIKPDGIGFHHRSHYNAYMYSLPALSNTLHHLRGTSFQVDAVSYQNLRSAFITMMRMSADGGGTTVGYFGHALSGRQPFSTNLPFSRDDLRRLGEWGGNIDGQAADSVIARAYNRRFGVNDYALFTPYGAEPPADGFHQFNYSPLGIYRRSNWVASIRAPQRFFWSTEIYTTENLYGRQQAYGALEILYHGGITMSGQQLSGWDWNHMPGTTTIVLPDAKLIDEDAREDVRSQLNFSGALSFRDGQSGLYACNFQEKNSGVNHNPTFVWRKSWFCFGNEIICLGSDIANNDASNSTATTLLQGKLATPSTPLTLDGAAITAFPHDSTANGGSAHWLLDAFGTGYLVQPGANVRITRSTQSAANETGTGSPTTGDFATAWLDHGTAPAGAAYEYAVFPGTDATAMAAASSQHASSATKPYEIVQRDTGAHVVKWKADGKTGYSIFTTTALPAATKNAGLLTAVERPCLVMTQLGTSADAWITLVDPDLNFTNAEASYGVPDASVARTLDFTVNGTWTPDPALTGVSLVSSTATTTTLRVTTQHGFAVHAHLLDGSTPGRKIWANLGNDWNTPAHWGANWGGSLPANDTVTDTAVLGSATVQPVLDTAYSVKSIEMAGSTDLSGTGNLTLGAGGIATTGSGNSLSLANVTLAASQTWDIAAGGMSVASAIGGSAPLTKSGAGTLSLSGNNTFTGGITVNPGSGLVTVGGNQSAATGGWLIGSSATSATTVEFFAGSSVNVAADRQFRIGNTSATGTANQTLNVSGNVSNAGSLIVGRPGIINLNSGAAWTQSGAMSVAAQGGYSAKLNVKAGSTWSYNGSPTVKLNGAHAGSGQSLLAIDGSFITSAGFEQTTIPTTGYARITLQNAGILKLSANVPSLVSGVQLLLGTGGGMIDTNGFSTTIGSGFSGGNLTKSGAGALSLTSAAIHTGSTTINGGTLSLNAPLLADASALTIASGAVLNADFTGTDQVASLTIAGVSLPSGTYSAMTHPAAITGSGRIKVGTGTSTFATWSATLGLSGNPDADADNDGIPDAAEFVLGGNPHAFSSAGMSAQRTNNDLILSFNREDASETGDLQLFVEAGESLDAWSQSIQIGATSSPGVTISENGDLPDTITVTIPANAARNFARIKVVTVGP